MKADIATQGADKNPVTPESLRNRYFLMRHGRSLANEKGIIISRHSHGGSKYGLVEQGRAQIRNAIQNQSVLDENTVIICSDFRRTRETAQLAAEILGTQQPESSTLLRERNFGAYEKTEDRNYNLVWVRDRQDDDNSDRNVESPAEVQHRFRRFISEMEKRYNRESILIVSHGDILQIAQTWPADIAPGQHRSLNHLETAEIRSLFPEG